uniref:Cell division protein ZapB n=2 Tax=Paracidobacterium acidisoli TaxID=2303751 RepID=A0A372ILS2_9BACT
MLSAVLPCIARLSLPTIQIRQKLFPEKPGNCRSKARIGFSCSTRKHRIPFPAPRTFSGTMVSHTMLFRGFPLYGRRYTSPRTIRFFTAFQRYTMSTLALQDAQLPIAADDFNELEQRVLRAVELLKAERQARAAAEQNSATLQLLLDEQSTELSRTQDQVRTLEKERDVVRQRVERLLTQLDEITA